MTGVIIKPTDDAEIAMSSNGSYHVTIPIKTMRRCRRQAVTVSDGTVFQPRPWDRDPTPIQQALTRGAPVAGDAGVRQGEKSVGSCRASRHGPSLCQPDAEPDHPGAGHRDRHSGRDVAQPREAV